MYTIGTYITEPIGNNEFHYHERIALGSKGEIFIPSLKQGTIDDLEEGSEIIFEEAENNKLKSCTGLKHFIQTDYHGIPVYIIDNHNHALTFRHKHRLNVGAFERFVVIHIDQHADTKPNSSEFRVQSSEGIENFVNDKTNVGNFISAAVNNGIVNEAIQIRTEHTLQHFGISTVQQGNVIVDIDMDFREEKTEQEIKSDFIIIRKLIDKACLITIATSPYFMNQKKAIEIIKEMLG